MNVSKLLFLSLAQLGSLSLKAQHTYELTFQSDHPEVVKVEASLQMDSTTQLQMNGWGYPEEIEKGWAHFVNKLSISDANNKSLSHDWVNNGWEVSGSSNQTIKVSYEVHLEHSNYNWDGGGGDDSRPNVINSQTIYLVSKALFIFPLSAELDSFTIQLNLPEDWTATTPWEIKSSNSFMANNVYHLANNALLVGKQEQQVFRKGEMELRLAVTPSIAHRSNLFVENLSELLPTYETLFEELPAGSFLIVLSEGPIEDGEAYTNSFHQILKDEGLSIRREVWLNTMAHEMFHYWNGQLFQAGPADTHYWFSEGFTEYYSNLSLVRSGLMEEQFLWGKLEKHFSRVFYVNRFWPGTVPSMALAGSEKLHYWPWVYGGGASFAFCLDVEIRHKTNNEKGLDHVMRLVNTRFGDGISTFNTQDLKDIVKEVVGESMDHWFDDYVWGLKPLPIIEQCEKANLFVGQFADEFYVKRNPKGSSGLLDGLLGR